MVGTRFCASAPRPTFLVQRFQGGVACKFGAGGHGLGRQPLAPCLEQARLHGAVGTAQHIGDLLCAAPHAGVQHQRNAIAGGQLRQGRLHRGILAQAGFHRAALLYQPLGIEQRQKTDPPSPPQIVILRRLAVTDQALQVGQQRPPVLRIERFDAGVLS